MNSCSPTAVGAITALAAAVEGVLELDADTLTDDELSAAVVEFHRQTARLAAGGAQLVAAFNARGAWATDGSSSAATWIAHHCHLPPEDAKAEVRLAKRLRSMPATSEALAAGKIGVAHARRLSGFNRPGLAGKFAEAEETLVDLARTKDWPDFERITTHWRHVVEPGKVEDEAATIRDQRRVHLSPGLDGTGILDGQLTPTAHAAVGSALQQIVDELFEDDWREARARLGAAATVSDLARTPAQRRHDALVQMAERAMTAPADGKRPLPLVSVFVGYETLAGRLCELANGTVVAPSTLDEVLPEGFIERIVFDGPDRPEAVGEQRLFTGALRRAIQVRDRHCTHPGCHVPAHRCQVDHIVPDSEGGVTELLNGRLLCPRHHRWRHRHDPPPDQLPLDSLDTG